MNDYEPPAVDDLDLRWGMPRWAFYGIGAAAVGLTGLLLYGVWWTFQER